MANDQPPKVRRKSIIRQNSDTNNSEKQPRTRRVSFCNVKEVQYFTADKNCPELLIESIVAPSPDASSRSEVTKNDETMDMFGDTPIETVIATPPDASSRSEVTKNDETLDMFGDAPNETVVATPPDASSRNEVTDNNETLDMFVDTLIETVAATPPDASSRNEVTDNNETMEIFRDASTFVMRTELGRLDLILEPSSVPEVVKHDETTEIFDEMEALRERTRHFERQLKKAKMELAFSEKKAREAAEVVRILVAAKKEKERNVELLARRVKYAEKSSLNSSMLSDRSFMDMTS